MRVKMVTATYLGNTRQGVVLTTDFSARWLCRTVMSYSPGAEEQHKGELKHARQHGVELLETWLILEYCDCGSLEDATLEGKYRDDLVSHPITLLGPYSICCARMHACGALNLSGWRLALSMLRLIKDA